MKDPIILTLVIKVKTSQKSPKTSQNHPQPPKNQPQPVTITQKSVTTNPNYAKKSECGVIFQNLGKKGDLGQI